MQMVGGHKFFLSSISDRIEINDRFNEGSLWTRDKKIWFQLENLLTSI